MIKLHDQTTAPEKAKPTLAAVDRANGFIPNLFRALANSPSTLNGFMAMMKENDDGTLSPAERQVIQLAASVENRGEYCVAGHSVFATQIGLPAETIAAVRDSRLLPNERYQALVDLTRTLVRNRGHVTADDRTAFEASGFEAAQILEVVACIALKTVTNFVSSAFQLPLDSQFQVQEWLGSNPRAALPRQEALAG